MKKFKMRWPSLGLEVICEGIGQNKAVLDTFIANMPVKALQGHEMVGGKILRDRAVRMGKRPFNEEVRAAATEKLKDAPVGRVVLLSPYGNGTELLVKYEDCVDDRDYIPVAQVHESDLPALEKAGKAAWRSATREQQIIIVEFTEVE